ncbi:MAG TPA: VOC family protein [Thermoanaerobaculia bacterium]|nr:VOC family protein [Thermoanaerobaculia bacterium]
MIGDSDAMATIAVRDLETAKRFYEDILGLKGSEKGEPGVVTYVSGRTKVIVYKSEYAGTNRATAATWVVPDAKTEVEALKAKGARFEHYDLPGLALEGDLHVAGSFKGAWLKDPDGNILHILSVGRADG